MKTTKYKHHGTEVSVMEENKGKHRDVCLCYQCEKFNPENRDENCPHANKLYETLADENNPILVSPVWECSEYKGK